MFTIDDDEEGEDSAQAAAVGDLLSFDFPLSIPSAQTQNSVFSLEAEGKDAALSPSSDCLAQLHPGPGLEAEEKFRQPAAPQEGSDSLGNNSPPSNRTSPEN